MCRSSCSPESRFVAEQWSPAVSHQPFVRPSYLRVPAPHRVLLCTHCGKCYIRKNYERHILEVHRLKGKSKRLVLEWLATEDIAGEEAEVQLPTLDQPPIAGLPIYDGYACNSMNCQYLTTSKKLRRNHVVKEHHRQYSRDREIVSIVRLQTFLAKSPQYFRVANIDPSPSTATFNTINTTHARNDLDDRHRLSLDHASPDTRRREAQYISEITPWLRVTGFHVHKQAIGAIDDFREVLRLPRRNDDLSLSLVCDSVDRLVRRGLDRLQNDQTGKRLHRLDAQHLDSVQIGVVSQDPLQRPDRAHRIRSYSSLFPQLVCYFFRVEDDCFGHAVFKVTDRQRQASIDVLEEAMRPAQAIDNEEPQTS